MKRRTRYLFIAGFAVFFLVAAPLVVFYVGGVRYDFCDKEYAKTGILSVETDPKNAVVTLDGTHSEDSPVDFRFLDPKEYQVTITKDGYFDWSKRLEVKAGKATIASAFLDKIYLLKKSSPLILHDQVIDYYLDDTILIYLTPDGINLIHTDNPSQAQTLKLTQRFEKLQASARGNYLLVSGEQRVMVLDVDAWRLFDATSLVATTTNWQITDTGVILALRQNTLVRIDPTTRQETALLPQVKAFAVLGSNLYYTQTTETQTVLAVTSLAAAASTVPQVLVDVLPESLASGQLMVTEQKDIVVLASGNLYKVNTTLDLIAADVQKLFFDAPSGTLIYATATELSWYEFLANKTHLITRNTQLISSPQLAANVGYAFYVQNNNIRAMELDTIDHQNNYSLAGAESIQSLKIDRDHKKLYFLEDQTLKSLEIR